jgi:glycosyltransferase involved in cell wall biosynthesis
MDKRLKIILNYQYNENWIGGTYYIQNLIQALNTLDDNQKPILIINSSDSKSIDDLFHVTKYPYFKGFKAAFPFDMLRRGFNKLLSIVTNKHFLKPNRNFDAIFPAHSPTEGIINKEIFWIPDFQEKHLPHFFSEKEINSRNNNHIQIKEKARFLVFSSKDAQNDFNTFYPFSNTKQYVLNFAAYHENSTLPDSQEVLDKFNIKTQYFLCSNQFWIHKNHIIILKAISLLKRDGIETQVVFTGKENDYRNPDYFTSLKNDVELLGIQNNVKFLGFIDRKDQIVLFKQATAIIQPSLFEGWSTVNEDAKAQNAFIIASNINIHSEQLKGYPNYRLFDPMDENSLANVIKENDFRIAEINYKENISKFGEDFLKIVRDIGIK